MKIKLGIVFLGMTAGLIRGYAYCHPQQDSSYTDSSDVFLLADTSAEDSTDDLVRLWYTQRASVACDSLFPGAEDTLMNLSSIPDSVFIQRLARIPSVIPLTYNHIVRNLIEMYLYKKRDVLESVLGLLSFYGPLIEEIIDEYDVPKELKYMAIIESALNPRACSRTRAVGLWQFMYGTGRLYGLTINSLVDERRDPVKATHAAIRFSKDLYDMFGDWQLVIAAYNCGPGNVRKAIIRSGGKKNFWDIYHYLPRETRGHVPAFIAAAYVVNYYREHNVVPAMPAIPLVTDTIVVRNKIHLGQIADVLGIPLTTLRDMNPQYLHDIVPAFNDIPYGIRLPIEYTEKFLRMEDSIRRYKETVYFNPSLDLRNPSPYRHVYVGKGKRIIHVVSEGETLGSIAMHYRVSVNQIKEWNGLRNHIIRTGQRLVIYSSRAASATGGKTASTAVTSDNRYQYYIVREGDTVWRIARQFPGVTPEDILRLNNLSSADKIVPGQKLIISSLQ